MILNQHTFAFDKKPMRVVDLISKDDVFGYLTQGYLYPKQQETLGGWIVINKATGEILLVNLHKMIYIEKSNKKALDNTKALMEDKPLKNVLN